MALSFDEMRDQCRTLGKISFWLRPESRTFVSANSKAITINDFEKLCGSIRNVRFDEDLAVQIVLTTALDMANGLIVEHAATLGFKLADFPIGYSLVSRLPNGDPGKELALTLTVLQLIIDGNELISARPEISERLEKLNETMTKLAEGGSDIPKIFTSIEDRIENCEEVTEAEIEKFIEQIKEDKTYQTHLPVFANHEYLLKGAKHVQFLQNAYKNSTTINKSFYDNLFITMESVVDRLSEEELETALLASDEYFEYVKVKKREYVPDFKQVINSEKSVTMLTTRLLILGPSVVCPELCTNLNESYNDSDKKGRWIDMVSSMPLPLHKMLLEGTLEGFLPLLLMGLFSIKTSSLFSDDNFRKPMDCLVLSGIFPLHKLVSKMLKDSDKFKKHFVRLFRCSSLKLCIKKAQSTEHWEETVQRMISAMSIVATPDSGIEKEPIKKLVRLLKNISEETMENFEWLSKYDDHEIVAEWTGLLPKPDESANEESAVTTEKEEEGEEIEKTHEDGDTEEEEDESEKGKEEEELDEDEEEKEQGGVDEEKKEGEGDGGMKENKVAAVVVEDLKDGQMAQQLGVEDQKETEEVDEENVDDTHNASKASQEEEEAGVDENEGDKEEEDDGKEEDCTVDNAAEENEKNGQPSYSRAEGVVEEEEKGSKRRQVTSQNLTDDDNATEDEYAPQVEVSDGAEEEIFPQADTRDEEGEGLAATQSTTNSQEMDEFSDSHTNLEE